MVTKGYTVRTGPNPSISLCSAIPALIPFLPRPGAIISSAKKFQIVRRFLYDSNKSHKPESESWCWLPNSEANSCTDYRFGPMLELDSAPVQLQCAKDLAIMFICTRLRLDVVNTDLSHLCFLWNHLRPHAEIWRGGNGSSLSATSCLFFNLDNYKHPKGGPVHYRTMKPWFLSEAPRSPVMETVNLIFKSPNEVFITSFCCDLV